MSEMLTEVSWTPVSTSVVISGALFSFGLFYFLGMRSKHANHPESPIFDIYEKRTMYKAHRSPPPWTGVGHGIYRWAKDAMRVDSTELLRCVGHDTYVFLRFLRFGFNATAIPSILTLSILLPINILGHETDGFNKVTLGNLPQESPRLWAAAILWYIYVPYVLWLLYEEWKHFFPLRYDYLARGDVDTPSCFRYAIIVENIPTKYRSKKALREYFEKLFPGTVYGTEVCQNTACLNALISERMDFVNKYEVADAKLHAYPDKPIPQTSVGGKMLCCSCGGQKVDAMPYYKEQIKRMNNEVDKERQRILEHLEKSNSSVDMTNVSGDSMDGPNVSEAQCKTVKDVKPLEREADTGFVVFNSLAAKQSAVQLELNGRYRVFDAFPAPDPNSIIWSNVTRKFNDQCFLKAMWGVIWCVGVLFWAGIVAFVQSISNLDSIVMKLGLGELDTSAVWYGIVAGYLPVVAFMLLMILLPMFIHFVAWNMIKLKSADQCDSYTFTWHQIFQFANLWLIIIGGTLFNQINTILDDVGKIVETLAEAIPGASVFFLNLIITSWGVLGLELSQIVEILVGWIMNKIMPAKAKPQRALDDKHSTNPIEWGLEIPKVVFIFLTSCVYFPIVPLVLPFAALYFGTAFVVFKHMCLHVYIQASEGGGAIWFSLFNYIMVCIYMSSITFIGYMGIKEMAVIASLGIIPLIAAIMMHIYIGKVYVNPLKNLSMEIAREVDVSNNAVDYKWEFYVQPNLRTDMDVREPLPYRCDAAGEILHEEEISQVMLDKTEDTSGTLSPNDCDNNCAKGLQTHDQTEAVESQEV